MGSWNVHQLVTSSLPVSISNYFLPLVHEFLRREIYGVGDGAATGAATTIPFLVGAATGAATGVSFGAETTDGEGDAVGASSPQEISTPNPLKKPWTVGHACATRFWNVSPLMKATTWSKIPWNCCAFDWPMEAISTNSASRVRREKNIIMIQLCSFGLFKWKQLSVIT